MAKKSYLNTPENMTVYMSKVLARDLRHYAGFCNAVLATIDYVEGPVWAMQLYIGKVTHWAILEEAGYVIYIYTGPLKPSPIIPQDQFYKRTVRRKGIEVSQIGTIEYNQRSEVCIRWQDE